MRKSRAPLGWTRIDDFGIEDEKFGGFHMTNVGARLTMKGWGLLDPGS